MRSSTPVAVPASSAAPVIRPSAATGDRILTADLRLRVQVRLGAGQDVVLAFGRGDDSSTGFFRCERETDDVYVCTVSAGELVPGVRYRLTAVVVGRAPLLDLLGDATEDLAALLSGADAVSEPLFVTRAPTAGAD